MAVPGQMFVLVVLLPIAASRDYPMKGITAKIVGGRNVGMKQFPFIGSLRFQGGDEHSCGVSLISKYLAMTAAHCFMDFNKTVHQDVPRIAVFGDVRLSVATSFHHESTFTAFIHPEFSLNGNDVAVIFLHNPVKNYNQNIQKIVLSGSSREGFIYSDCFIIGWGLTQENGSNPDNLQYARVSIYDADECAVFNDTLPFHQRTMLCAGNETADACLGDSGGPLACRRSGSTEYELVGIVSYGKSVCEIGHPGVYTRVSAFLDFLESVRELIGNVSYNNAMSQLQLSISFVICMASLAVSFPH